MRALVFLLVLANLLFLAFAQGLFGVPGNPDSERVSQQVRPEKIVVVSRGEPPAVPAVESPAKVEEPAPAPAAPPAKAQDKAPEPKAADNKPACLAWNGLNGADGDRLVVLAADKYSGLNVSRSGTAEATNYWVFIPPLATRQDAERKSGELKKLGVSDFFVVQEPGANHLAISLGIFSTEQAARDQLEALKGQGVRSAKMGPRTPRSALVRLEVRGKASLVEGFKAAAAGLVGQSRPEACPAAKAPAKSGASG